MRRPQKPASDENTLLGDLESIRQLLESSAGGIERRSPSPGEDAADVPMLDDVVDGGLQLDEAPLSSRDRFEDDGEGPSALADDTIEALLGDQWRDSAERIIRGTRQALSAASARWSDAASDTLRDALRARIDDTLDDWMAEVTLNHLDDLRQRLLDALEDEVARVAHELSAGEDEDEDQDEERNHGE